MELLLSVLFVLPAVLIAYAAREDNQKKEIPDITNAGLWVLACMVGWLNPFVFMVTVFTFALLFWLNSLAGKKAVLSWGDILLIPPVAGIMAYQPLAILALGVFVIIGLSWAYRKKEEEPLAPYVAVAYLLFLLAQFGVLSS